METNQLEILARIVLPSDILDCFEIVNVEQTSTEIHIHLDELINPSLSCDVHFESKGFMEPTHLRMPFFIAIFLCFLKNSIRQDMTLLKKPDGLF